MPKTVDRAIFTEGTADTREQQEKFHGLVKHIIKKYTESDEDYVPIISSGPLPEKYSMLCGGSTTIFRLALGDSELGPELDYFVVGPGVDVREVHKQKEILHVSEVPKKAYDTMLKDNMIKFFVKRGKKVVTTNIPEEAEAAEKAMKKIISEETIQAAKTAVSLAIGSAMFYGVQNLFGLSNDIFGDAGLPYIPDVIVGTIPFYSAQKLERGMSDRALKYRAIGDVFLAHQRGATDTLRIDLTLFGPYRSWYLLYLLSLEQKGESKLQELQLIETGIKAPVNPLPGEELKIPKKGKVQYETHTTFPIITQTAFMLDMFLQTIEWHQEKDKGGNEVIYVHLLFRKHIDPKGYVVFDKNDKTGYTHYGETLSERRRKEAMIDTMWKCARIGKETLLVGLFGGSNIESIDREAVTSDPYISNINSLIGGYAFDINNIESFIPGIGW